jgi:hypothetical protein
MHTATQVQTDISLERADRPLHKAGGRGHGSQGEAVQKKEETASASGG